MMFDYGNPKTPKGIIYERFDNDGNTDLCSMINYLDVDTVVAWFVDEGFIDSLDEEDQKIINEHYELHCM